MKSLTFLFISFIMINSAHSAIISHYPENQPANVPTGKLEIAVEFDGYGGGNYPINITPNVNSSQYQADYNKLTYYYTNPVDANSLVYVNLYQGRRVKQLSQNLLPNTVYMVSVPDYGYNFSFTTGYNAHLNDEMELLTGYNSIYPKAKTASCQDFYVVAWQTPSSLFLMKMGWDNQPLNWYTGESMLLFESGYYYSTTQTLSIAMNDSCYMIVGVEVDDDVKNLANTEDKFRTYDPEGHLLWTYTAIHSIPQYVRDTKDSYRLAWDKSGNDVSITESGKIAMTYQAPMFTQICWSNCKVRKYDHDNYIKVIVADDIYGSGVRYLGDDWGNDGWHENRGKIVNIPPLKDQPGYGPKGLSHGAHNGGSSHDGAVHPYIHCDEMYCEVSWTEISGNSHGSCQFCGGDNIALRAFNWNWTERSTELGVNNSTSNGYDRWMARPKIGPEGINSITWLDSTSPYPNLSDVHLMLTDITTVIANSWGHNLVIGKLTSEIKVNSYKVGDQIAPVSVWNHISGELAVGWWSNGANAGGFGSYVRKLDNSGNFLTGDIRVNDFDSTKMDWEEYKNRAFSNIWWSNPNGMSGNKWGDLAFAYSIPNYLVYEGQGYSGGNTSHGKSDNVHYNSMVNTTCSGMGVMLKPNGSIEPFNLQYGYNQLIDHGPAPTQESHGIFWYIYYLIWYILQNGINIHTNSGTFTENVYLDSPGVDVNWMAGNNCWGERQTTLNGNLTISEGSMNLVDGKLVIN